MTILVPITIIASTVMPPNPRLTFKYAASQSKSDPSQSAQKRSGVRMMSIALHFASTTSRRNARMASSALDATMKIITKATINRHHAEARGSEFLRNTTPQDNAASTMRLQSSVFRS